MKRVLTISLGLLASLVLMPVIWNRLGRFAGAHAEGMAESLTFYPVNALVPFFLLFLGWYLSSSVVTFLARHVIRRPMILGVISSFLGVMFSTIAFGGGYNVIIEAASVKGICNAWNPGFLILLSAVGGAAAGYYVLAQAIPNASDAT